MIGWLALLVGWLGDSQSNGKPWEEKIQGKKVVPHWDGISRLIWEEPKELPRKTPIEKKLFTTHGEWVD